jgi:uncharacterized protein (PEP-CTERM system associated)
VRNTVLLSVYREDREALSPESALAGGDFGLSLKARQTGASMSWVLALSPITSTSLSLGLARNEFPESNALDERRKFARAAVTRQFTPRLSGTFIVRRQQGDSASPGLDYRENAVSAIVTARF